MTPCPPHDPRITHLALGWEPLAIAEADGATLWPRALYPCAEDALRAAEYASGNYWESWEPIPDGVAWIVWAWESDDGPEDGWWEWAYVPGSPAERAATFSSVECWEVVLI